MRLLRLAAALLVFPLACSRGPATDAIRVPSGEGERRSLAFDWDRPASALELGPEDVAARLGSFEWTAAVEWTIARREGEDARRIRAVERHHVRLSPRRASSRSTPTSTPASGLAPSPARRSCSPAA